MSRNTLTTFFNKPVASLDYLDAVEAIDKVLATIEKNKAEMLPLDERSAKRQQKIRDAAAIAGYPYSDNYIPDYTAHNFRGSN